MFWLIFSILGVQLFAGKFYKCVDSEGNRLSASEVPDKATCDELSHNRTYEWKNSDINFDNVASGFLVLFQVVSFRVRITRILGYFVAVKIPFEIQKYQKC